MFIFVVLHLSFLFLSTFLCFFYVRYDLLKRKYVNLAEEEINDPELLLAEELLSKALERFRSLQNSYDARKFKKFLVYLHQGIAANWLPLLQ